MKLFGLEDAEYWILGIIILALIGVSILNGLYRASFDFCYIWIYDDVNSREIKIPCRWSPDAIVVRSAGEDYKGIPRDCYVKVENKYECLVDGRWKDGPDWDR